MLTRRVVMTRRAQKDVRVVPPYVADKLLAWVKAVELRGLEEVRRVPGFHDEPLLGMRWGQRSIRLSLHYRAIYRVVGNGDHAVIEVLEVNKHAY